MPVVAIAPVVLAVLVAACFGNCFGNMCVFAEAIAASMALSVSAKGEVGVVAAGAGGVEVALSTVLSVLVGAGVGVRTGVSTGCGGGRGSGVLVVAVVLAVVVSLEVVAVEAAVSAVVVAVVVPAACAVALCPTPIAASIDCNIVRGFLPILFFAAKAGAPVKSISVAAAAILYCAVFEYSLDIYFFCFGAFFKYPHLREGKVGDKGKDRGNSECC